MCFNHYCLHLEICNQFKLKERRLNFNYSEICGHMTQSRALRTLDLCLVSNDRSELCRATDYRTLVVTYDGIVKLDSNSGNINMVLQ